jgi:heme exporter protein C
VAALAATAIMALGVSPPDVEQREAIRLMYIHVPTAWLAYLAFAVVFVTSIGYLVRKQVRWDRVAAASAEVGVLFTALTIVIGAIWAKPVWGVWWTWDPRLTATAILLLVYLGYLAIRRLSDNPVRRASWAAVVGIVGFLDVPIVHLSVRWWRSQHQAPARLLGVPDLAPIMWATLLLAVAAFTILYLYLVSVRLRVGRLEERAVAEALAPWIGRPAGAPLPDERSPVDEPPGAADRPLEETRTGEVPARG